MDADGKAVVLGEAVEYNRRLREVLEWLSESDMAVDVGSLRKAL